MLSFLASIIISKLPYYICRKHFNKSKNIKLSSYLSNNSQFIAIKGVWLAANKLKWNNINSHLIFILLILILNQKNLQELLPIAFRHLSLMLFDHHRSPTAKYIVYLYI